ncbi:hypothetical protein PT2222_140360 [Paraburkholderia tropica]
MSQIKCPAFKNVSCHFIIYIIAYVLNRRWYFVCIANVSAFNIVQFHSSSKIA